MTNADKIRCMTNKETNKVPGIFCLNTKCKHYFEDNCMKFFEKNTLNISPNGEYKDFESRENEGYRYC